MIAARYRARLKEIFSEVGRCDKLSLCYRKAAALNQHIIGDISKSDDALVEKTIAKNFY